MPRSIRLPRPLAAIRWATARCRSSACPGGIPTAHQVSLARPSRALLCGRGRAADLSRAARQRPAGAAAGGGVRLGHRGLALPRGPADPGLRAPRRLAGPARRRRCGARPALCLPLRPGRHRGRPLRPSARAARDGPRPRHDHAAHGGPGRRRWAAPADRRAGHPGHLLLRLLRAGHRRVPAAPGPRRDRAGAGQQRLGLARQPGLRHRPGHRRRHHPGHRRPDAGLRAQRSVVRRRRLRPVAPAVEQVARPAGRGRARARDGGGAGAHAGRAGRDAGQRHAAAGRPGPHERGGWVRVRWPRRADGRDRHRHPAPGCRRHRCPERGDRARRTRRRAGRRRAGPSPPPGRAARGRGAGDGRRHRRPRPHLQPDARGRGAGRSVPGQLDRRDRVAHPAAAAGARYRARTGHRGHRNR